MIKYLALFSSLVLFNSLRCYSQSELDSCIKMLHSRDYLYVAKAKDAIVSKYQKNAIPRLIAMLQDTGYAKLINTMDLIYPGAEKFYGHGGVINYDIDWISVRAGWILEEITFVDFGYLSRFSIGEKKLTAIHNDDYKNYLRQGYHNVDFTDITQSSRLIRSRMSLADSVKRWWNANEQNWTTLNALKAALTSKNDFRENLAIQYLRYSNGFVTEPDRKIINSYYPALKKMIRQIKRSKSSASDQAGYLLQHIKYVEVRK